MISGFAISFQFVTVMVQMATMCHSSSSLFFHVFQITNYIEVASVYLKPFLQQSIQDNKYMNFSDVENSFLDGYIEVNDEIYDRPFDVNFSGSTSVSGLIVGSKLYTINVGDSRAVIISFDEKE